VIFVLLYAIARAWSEVISTENVENKNSITKLLIGILIISTSQILLGTQVREAIDRVIANPFFGYNRETWIEQMGLTFYVHRSYSILILGLHLFLIWKLQKNTKQEGLISVFTKALLFIVIIEILTGGIMAYFGVPAYIQPVHLTLAIISVGIQFVILLLLNFKNVTRFSES